MAGAGESIDHGRQSAVVAVAAEGALAQGVDDDEQHVRARVRRARSAAGGQDARDGDAHTLELDADWPDRIRALAALHATEGELVAAAWFRSERPAA